MLHKALPGNNNGFMRFMPSRRGVAQTLQFIYTLHFYLKWKCLISKYVSNSGHSFLSLFIFKHKKLNLQHRIYEYVYSMLTAQIFVFKD